MVPTRVGVDRPAGRVDLDVDAALTGDLGVVQGPGYRRVAGVLPRSGVDPVRGSELRCGGAGAGGPVGDVLIAPRERTCIGAILELPLVRVPVADVDDESGEQQEHRDHDGAEDDDLTRSLSRHRPLMFRTPSV